MTTTPHPPASFLFLGGPLDGQWLGATVDHLQVPITPARMALFGAEPGDTAPAFPTRTYVRRRLNMFGRLLDVYVDDSLDQDATDDAAWRLLASVEAKASLLGSSMNRLRSRGAL